ncbi:PREDICTED: uncharacterized protein LOC104735365 isoform X2 [Camelina sativa]|uniref:Uncharacterized protein LOC104735365 isoform X2 n=1 Tax=Camelina sativa TaxID=90675 RepID=A0ABM0VAR5_CAMSA|nr:PREDICTED: uncharacterized protein LOC104735365 isoform X2 [Camelina sativa]
MLMLTTMLMLFASTTAKQWKPMVPKSTFVGPAFTRKPPKYERFIRPSGLRFTKPHVTHPELKCTFCLEIIGVKKNPNGPMYPSLGVMTRGRIKGSNQWEYGHEYFVRGQPELLVKMMVKTGMRRQSQSQSGSRSCGPLATLTNLIKSRLGLEHSLSSAKKPDDGFFQHDVINLSLVMIFFTYQVEACAIGRTGLLAMGKSKLETPKV